MSENAGEKNPRNLAKRTHEMMMSLAQKDPLTGLLNRRGFNNELDIAFKHAQRFDEKLTLIFLDADNFKHVNEKYTRLVGDEVLKSIADAMKNTFRASDVLARWGGDEFVVIGTDLPTDQSFKIDNLQKRLNDNLHKCKPENVSESDLGVTIGIQAWDGKSSLIEFQKKVQDHMDSRK